MTFTQSLQKMNEDTAADRAAYQAICSLGTDRDMEAFSAATKYATRKGNRQARKGNTECTWFADFNAKYAALTK